MKLFSVILYIIVIFIIFFGRIFISGLITPEILYHIAYMASENSFYLILPGLATSFLVGLIFGVPFGILVYHKCLYIGIIVPSIVVAAYISKSSPVMLKNIYFLIDQILFVLVFFFLFQLGCSIQKKYKK